MEKKTALLILLLLISCTLVAQPLLNAFKKFTVEDGIPDPFISALCLDENGFLWIGTLNGLCRYDGSEFIKYNNQPRVTPILSNSILSIKSIYKNKLLVCTNKGLCIYDTETNKFTSASSLEKKNKAVVQTFYYSYYDGSNTILVASNKTLYGIDTSLNVKYRIEQSNILGLKKIERIQKIGNDIIALVSLTNEKFNYYFIRDNKMTLVEGNKNYLNFMQSTSLQSDLLSDQKKRIYGLKLLQDSVFVLEPNSTSFIPFKIVNSQPYQFYYSTQFISQNDSLLVCASSAGGIIVFKKPEFINPRQLKGESYLKNNSISCTVFDHWGNIWIGTSQGLFKAEVNNTGLNTHGFSIHKSLTEQSGNNEKIFFEGGDIFITTSGNGVYYNDILNDINNWKNITWKGKSIKCNDVWNIRQNTPDSIWIGTQKGVQWFCKKSNTTGGVKWNKPYEWIDSVPITTQFEDGHNLLWMGLGYGRGLATYDTKQQKIVYFFNGAKHGSFPLRYPTNICEDAHGNIWMSNYNPEKILVWDRQSKRISPFQDLHKKFPDVTAVVSLAADKSGNVWYGTNCGLIQLHLKTKRLKRYSLPNDITVYDVNNLEASHDSTIWFSSRRGIYYFKNNAIHKHRITNQFNDSIITDIKYSVTNGKVYFLTPNTVTSFNAEAEPHPKQPLRIYITKIMIDESAMDISGEEIKLPYHYQIFTLKFSALNLNDGLANKFFYSLNEKQWIALENQRQLNLINLKPGKHILKLKALNSSGKWSINEVILKINVDHPFWQTWYFIISCMLVIGGIIYLTFQFRISQLIRLQNIRNGIARNLHDDIGASLTNINILTSLSIKHLVDHDKTKNFLTRISEEISSSAESLDDIVWSINSNVDTLDSMLTRMRRYALELFENSDISLSVQIVETNIDRKLNMEQRLDIYLIFKESLTNIAKHAKANVVIVKIEEENNQLKMVFKDDGIGFDTTKESERNGLKNIKKRTEVWKGIYRINSIEGQGTTLNILIPLKQKL